MAICKDCLTCIEKCPKDEDMKNIAQGRMWATKELIEINKKIDSGVLVEVVRCSECQQYTPVEGGKPLCALHNIACSGDDFCSYGERRSD